MHNFAVIAMENFKQIVKEQGAPVDQPVDGNLMQQAFIRLVWDKATGN